MLSKYWKNKHIFFSFYLLMINFWFNIMRKTKHLSISPSLSISLLIPFFLSLSLLSIILFGVSNRRFRPCYSYNLHKVVKNVVGTPKCEIILVLPNIAILVFSLVFFVKLLLLIFFASFFELSLYSYFSSNYCDCVSYHTFLL